MTQNIRKNNFKIEIEKELLSFMNGCYDIIE